MLLGRARGGPWCSVCPWPRAGGSQDSLPKDGPGGADRHGDGSSSLSLHGTLGLCRAGLPVVRPSSAEAFGDQTVQEVPRPRVPVPTAACLGFINQRRAPCTGIASLIQECPRTFAHHALLQPACCLPPNPLAFLCLCASPKHRAALFPCFLRWDGLRLSPTAGPPGPSCQALQTLHSFFRGCLCSPRRLVDFCVSEKQLRGRRAVCFCRPRRASGLCS